MPKKEHWPVHMQVTHDAYNEAALVAGLKAIGCKRITCTPLPDGMLKSYIYCQVKHLQQVFAIVEKHGASWNY